MQYCNACKRDVTPKKDFNWLVLIFLCGVCYIPVYLLQAPHCPICNGKDFAPPQG
jgi:hypothetical protein